MKQAKFERILHGATPEKGLREGQDILFHVLLNARTMLGQGSE
jgi:hypothetical protein